jgi:hypothetical protein
MRHFIAGFLLTFACASLDAALPLALLGKQIIQSIVQSLVEDAIHATLLATLGPCDGALASSALINAQALLGSRGGIPGLPSGLPGGSGMPALPAGVPGLPPGLAGGGAMTGAAGGLGAMAGAGALAGGIGSLPIGNLSALGVGGSTERLPPQMREMMRKQLEEELRERRADQRKRGLTPEQIEDEDRQLAQEQLRQSEEIMAMLRDSQPLSTAELDEFVSQYEKLSKLAPDSAPCSPESLRRLLTPAAAIPMAAAPIRMMLRSFHEIDRGMVEARQTFAAMTPADQAEFVRQMSDQIEDWSEENRQGFGSLLRTNPFGMPEPLRDELLKKLN